MSNKNIQKGIFSSEGRSVIQDVPDKNALLKVELENKSSFIELAVIHTQGGVTPSIQYMQDVQGEVYTIVFGQRLQPYTFTCYAPLSICKSQENMVAKPQDIFKEIKAGIDRKEAIVAKMEYHDAHFKGYIHDIKFKTGPINPSSNVVSTLVTIIMMGVMV